MQRPFAVVTLKKSCLAPSDMRYFNTREEAQEELTDRLCYLPSDYTAMIITKDLPDYL